MRFLELNESEYEEFAQFHPYRNFLNAQYAFALKEENGFQIAYVGVKEGDTLLAATGIVFCPCLRFFTYAYAQRGYLIDYENEELLTFFHKEMIAYCKNHKAIYIKMDPYICYQEHDIHGDIVKNGFQNKDILKKLKQLGYQHQGFTTGFSSNSQVRWSFVLELEGKNEETLLKEMDHQTRWSIHKTLKLGVKVKEASQDEVESFYKMQEYAAKTRNFEVLPIAYYQQRIRVLKENAKLMIAYIDVIEYKQILAEDLKKEEMALQGIEEKLKETPNSKKYKKKRNVQLEAIETVKRRISKADRLQAKYGNRIDIASAFFIHDVDELVYVTSGAYDEFREFNGPYAIQWQMLRYALQHQIKRYNFYGISGDFHEDGEDYGVYKFKKGFGGVVEEYIGDFIYPINTLLYRLNVSRRRR